MIRTAAARVPEELASGSSCGRLSRRPHGSKAQDGRRREQERSPELVNAHTMRVDCWNRSLLSATALEYGRHVVRRGVPLSRDEQGKGGDSREGEDLRERGCGCVKVTRGTAALAHPNYLHVGVYRSFRQLCKFVPAKQFENSLITNMPL